MIDAGCRSSSNGIEGAHERGIVDSFLVQCPVKPPPPLLQDLYEIGLRPCRYKHSAGKAGIVMMMRAYIAGDDNLSRSIDDLRSRKPCSGILPRCCDHRSFNDDIRILNDIKRRLRLHYHRIPDDYICHHSSTGPRRYEYERYIFSIIAAISSGTSASRLPSRPIRPSDTLPSSLISTVSPSA